MAIHQPPAYAPPTPQPPPAPPAEHVRQRRRGGVLLLTFLTLAVAIAAAVMSGIALVRNPAPAPAVPSVPAHPSPSASTPTSAEVAAAKKTTCDAWDAAAQGMTTARQPFLDRTQPGTQWTWSDPAIAEALGQAQAGIVVQVEYLRQHIAPSTPAEITAPVNDFINANVDLVALDGQHQSAAVANAAAERANGAAEKIRTACGS